MKESAEDILDLIDLYLGGWGHGTVLIAQVQCLTKTMRADMKTVIEPYEKEYLAKKKARKK